MRSARPSFTLSASLALVLFLPPAPLPGGRAAGFPARPEAPDLAVRTLIASTDSLTLSAYVLVENRGYRPVELPGDFSQSISESFQLGRGTFMSTSRALMCPGGRGILELRPGHCIGRLVKVRRPARATAVRFRVDLGEGMGPLEGAWTPL